MQQSALSPDFLCDVQPDRDRVIVRLVGELDFAEAPALDATLHELLEAGFTRIVVDLRDLRFLDSAGLHRLIVARRAAELRECTLSLVRGPENVHRVFELTATESLFAFDGAELVP
jgi:anti-anti-sigma factor